MPIPVRQALKVGLYLFKQKLLRKKRYPLVLMLEPLFRCNVECLGCGKIQKPNEILKQNMSTEDCLNAANECDAPIVSIAGGEPLIHPEINAIIQGLLDQGRFVYLCTNAILLERFFDKLPVHPNLTLSIHLDGLKNEHDHILQREGTFDEVVEAIREAKKRGFRVTTNTTFFDGTTVEDATRFLDFLSPLGVDGMTMAAAFQYLAAPNQEKFIGRKKTFRFFEELLAKNVNGRKWDFNHSPFYLDFLKGKRDYNCTPWGNPNYSILGWQRPCYLLDEGYATTFKELMEDTRWEDYGHLNNPKCADCTAHCGYEATAVEDSTSSIGNMIHSAVGIFK